MKLICSECRCEDHEIAYYGTDPESYFTGIRCIGCGHICEIHSPYRYNTNKLVNKKEDK